MTTAEKPTAEKPMSPREYGAYLASKRTKPLSDEQVEAAARILAAVPQEEPASEDSAA